MYKVEFKGLTGAPKKISGILGLSFWELLTSLSHGTHGGICLTGFGILCQDLIGFTLLYFKMAVMPLVPEAKMADVGKLISRGNLLDRKTAWLVLTTTSATAILSRVFGAYCMTRIVCKYSHLPTLILFHIFTYRGNTFFLLWLPERKLSLSPFRL